MPVQSVLLTYFNYSILCLCLCLLSLQTGAVGSNFENSTILKLDLLSYMSLSPSLPHFVSYPSLCVFLIYFSLSLIHQQLILSLTHSNFPLYQSSRERERQRQRNKYNGQKDKFTIHVCMVLNVHLPIRIWVYVSHYSFN